MLKLLRSLLLAVAALAALADNQSFAGSGSLVVKDGNGASQTFQATTDASSWLLSNYVLCDGVAGAYCATVKAASTAAVASDPSVVVALSPNSPLPAGSNAIGSVTVSNFPATQPVSAAALPLPSNAAQETGGNLAAIASSILSQGSSTSGQKGSLMFGAVTAAAPSYTAGQSSPLSLDASGNLRVNVMAGGGTGGTSSNFNAAFPGTGTAIGGEYLSAAPTLTSGQMVALQTDVNGNLKVNIASGGGTGGTASSFGAAFPASGTAAGLEYLSAAPTLTSGNMAAFQGDVNGNLKTVLAAALPAGSNVIGGVTQSGTWNIGSITTLPALPAGSNVIGGVTQSGTWTVQPGNTANTTPWLASISQGGNTAAVKAASTAAAATDPSLTVALSPNSPLPAGSNAIGTVNIGTGGITGFAAGGAFSGSNGLMVGGEGSGNWNPLIQPDSSAPINISTATTTQLVALVSGKKIYVSGWDVVAGGTGNFQLEYGTGTNCGTGTTALTGAYNLTAQSGLSRGAGVGVVFVVPAGNALCAVTSAAVQMSGSVSYTQF
jgi:hypothetical protein